MQKDLRKNKNGSIYYSFTYFDKELGKKVRLSRAYIQNRFGRDLTTTTEAEAVIKILNAEFETVRIKLEKRTQWEKEFYNFSSLLNNYTIKQRKRAPNSYKNNVHYLRYYVLHYFLMIAKCNNIDFWPDIYEEFREWLETKATLIKGANKLISYGSKNHCIKALNTFMRLLHREKVINKLILCEKFPSYQLNERSIDDVISQDEMHAIVKQLKSQNNHFEAVFLKFLYFSGMRFNEGLGLSLQDVYPGQVQHKVLRKLLDRYDIEHYGYIVLASQPANESRGLRNKNGSIPRKPLKGRKKISEKYSRIVVIPDKDLWQELVALYNHQVDEMNVRRWGVNPSDYALFEGIHRTTSTRKLQQAYKVLDLRYRCWQCCRHSCATNLIGQTGDYNLARLWLGHSSPSVIERYVHIHQAIVRASQKFEEGKRTEIKKLDF